MQLTAIWIIFTFILASVESATAQVQWNYTRTPNPLYGIRNGTHINDLRQACDPRSFDIVKSKSRSNVIYLKGSCKGRYQDASTPRCSYLDLNMCYGNANGEIKPQAFGNAMNSCDHCSYYNYNDYTFITCQCTKDDQSRQRFDIQLDSLLTSKNGFLSCWGFTNFECPKDGVDF